MGKCNYVVHVKINKNKFNIFIKEKIFFLMVQEKWLFRMEGEETENISKFEEIKNELLKAKSTDEKVQVLEQLASAISDISGNDILIAIL